jgi:DNA-binding Xre family transcriptional regulator/molecular chaperone GrpE (heat shock protein)
VLGGKILHKYPNQDLPLPMSQTFNPDFTYSLQQLMQRVDITSFQALSKKAGISEKQLRRLRKGEIEQLRVETLLKLAQALEVSVSELLTTFSSGGATLEGLPQQEVESKAIPPWLPQQDSQSLAVLKQEYQKLQQQLENQRETLKQEFQKSSLQILESWLLQWPTAAYAAGQNQQLPAVRLLPLLRPVEQLMQEWGVEAIASVGSEIPYDPQWHQLMDGTVAPGELVKVRYVGYRSAGKLLHRAKVSPISNANKG